MKTHTSKTQRKQKSLHAEQSVPLIRDFTTTISPEAASVIRRIAGAMTERFADNDPPPKFDDESVLVDCLSRGLHLMGMDYTGSDGAWSAQTTLSDPKRAAGRESRQTIQQDSPTPWPIEVEERLRQLARRMTSLEVAHEEITGKSMSGVYVGPPAWERKARKGRR